MIPAPPTVSALAGVAVSCASDSAEWAVPEDYARQIRVKPC